MFSSDTKPLPNAFESQIALQTGLLLPTGWSLRTAQPYETKI